MAGYRHEKRSTRSKLGSTSRATYRPACSLTTVAAQGFYPLRRYLLPLHIYERLHGKPKALPLPRGIAETSMSKTLYNFGCKLSGMGANLAGHPMSILTVAVVCAAWFIVGGTAAENTLTLALSVLAITLTQMVLNQQRLSGARAAHEDRRTCFSP